MKFLLDTNVVIGLSKGAPAIREKLASIPARALVLSPIVLSELAYGIAKSARPQANQAVLDNLLAGLPVSAVDADIAGHYGRIRVALEQAGQIIGPNDLLIAAHALSLGAVVVTDNVREFARVPGLSVENWLE